MSKRATEDAFSSYYFNTIIKSLAYWGYSWSFVSCNGSVCFKIWFYQLCSTVPIFSRV